MGDHVLDADFEEVANQRHGDRRRSTDRRAPRLRLDPCFAATLIAQISPPAMARVGSYRVSAARAGLTINLRA